MEKAKMLKYENKVGFYAHAPPEGPEALILL